MVFQVLARGALVAALALVPTSAAVRADVFGFIGITANDPSLASIAAGEAQLSVEVIDAGGGQVLFTLRNDGPHASFIRNIYFDDSEGTLGSLAAIDNSDPGVEFAPGGSPSDVPGAVDIGFTSDFHATATQPGSQNGVNETGESVGILFHIAPGSTFDDVLDSMYFGQLRVGLHVQGFEGGFSEGFVSGLVATPEPATLALALIALAILTGAAYRRRAAI